MTTSPWPMIHEERKALAADLDGLTAEQWSTPSLCTDWNIQQALGHMTATAKMTPGKFFGKLLGSGFRFNAMSAKNVADNTRGTPAETLAAFKAEITSTTSPPGPVDSWLGETVIHSEDIRRPLGIAHEYQPEALTRVADFYKGSNLIVGAKKRIAGLTLRATDADWSTGSGPEVTGPLLSLVMAMVGRGAVIGDLSGEGVATLQQRL